MPDGPPAAWIVVVFGLWVLVSPFVFGVTGTYMGILVVAGALVAILAAYRGMNTDENVPLPALPIAVFILGIVTLGSPLVFADSLTSIHSATLYVSGIIFIVIPAMMVNKAINKQQAAAQA